MNNNYEQIEQLMLLKDFEALSFQEKAFVQNLMSPEDYQQQRKILIESKQLLAQKSALPEIQLSNLQAHFKALHLNKPIWKTRTIPIYQAVLCTALIGFIMWYWRPVQIETEVQNRIVYRTKVDTVFYEKLVVEEKVVYKNKVIKVPTILMDTVYIPMIDKEQFYQEKENNTIFAKQIPKGKTMKEMGDLMDFVVGTE